MTIYSQHPNRGKVQILATYEGSAGATSSTVTSLPDAGLASPIVDALNRISALATVPVSVHDTRDGQIRYYPREHLAALTDRSARAHLLNGAHSLWYEHVKLLLHQALSDLDDAMAKVPEPVRAAVNAELEEEARELRGELADFSGEDPPPGTKNSRRWHFNFPFVLFNGEIPDLADGSREYMDKHEEGITSEQREKAVADLRVLVTAYMQCHGDPGILESDEFEIFHDPDGPDRYYLTVTTPRPDDDADVWHVEIGQWVSDDPEDEECSSATGHILVGCACPVPPTAAEITDLLNRSEEKPELLAVWAETPVGAALGGTPFVVTERHVI
ncbi:hypothetical protein [Nonomuraea sp. NPDC049028]|uniref:hypothetical protein n=1 Tax=Nonomuraea sp. NPDC049028 TaxID=3364348 RepID=UPI00371C1414